MSPSEMVLDRFSAHLSGCAPAASKSSRCGEGRAGATGQTPPADAPWLGQPRRWLPSQFL